MKKIIIGIAAAALLLAGCSSATESAESAEVVEEEVTQTPMATTFPEPVSEPSGNPAGTTDAELFQGCLDAKTVIQMFELTSVDQLIALAQIDESDSTDTVTVETGDGTSWADATAEEKAAVRTAAEMAFNGDC